MEQGQAVAESKKGQVVFDQVIREDEQIAELVQLLRRLRLQSYKDVEVVVMVTHNR